MSNAYTELSTVPRVALMTGATGFVGSHLARRLVRDGWQVHVLSRAGSRLPDAPEFTHVVNHAHDGSIEGMVACVSQAKPDVVFHLASLFLSQHATKDIDSLIQSNVLFGNQLLEAMRVNEVSCLINTGTSWQHYNNEGYNPVCLYAATKQAFEAIMEYYIQACGIKVVTLKLFDTYGPNDPRPKLLHLLKKNAQETSIMAMSPGEQVIDMVHVDDVVEAFAIASERLMNALVDGHEKYAVTSGTPMSLRSVVKTFEEAIGQKINIEWGGRPYRTREVMKLWDNGECLPGWSPSISLRSGIADLISVKEKGDI